MDRIEKHVRSKCTPILKHIFWVAERKNSWVEACLEEIVIRVLNIVGPRVWENKLNSIINEKLEEVVWKDAVYDMWYAKVDTFEDSTLVKDKRKFEEIEVKQIIDNAKIVAWKDASLDELIKHMTDTKKMKIIMFVLKQNWFEKPTAFFTSDFNKKLSWDFWIFGDFWKIYEVVTSKKYTKNVTNEDLVSFVSKIKYKRNLLICSVKLIREAWIILRDDLEKMWMKDFCKKDFYKWITWKFILELVLWEKVSKLNNNKYTKFLDLIDFDKKGDVADTTEIKNRAREKSTDSNIFTGQKKKDFLSKLSRDEIKDLALKTLNNQWYYTILDILLFRDSYKVMWNFSPFSSFLSLFNKVTNLTNSSLGIYKLSEFFNNFFWWKTLEEEVSFLFRDENIEWITDISSLLSSEFYYELYPENWNKPLVFTWDDLIRLVLNKNNKAFITSKLLSDFFTKIWRKELINRFVKEEYRSVMKRPEEFLNLSEKEFLKKVNQILAKNWYSNIYYLFIAKNNSDFPWVFTPFNSFTHLSNCVLQRRISHHSWLSVNILKDLSKKLSWDDIEISIREKIEVNKDMIMNLKDLNDIQKFWDSIYYINKSGLYIDWAYLIKSYLGLSYLHKLNRQKLKEFLYEFEMDYLVKFE